MNQPLVTISIPLYKCEDFLEKCLDSVRAQSYTNLEVTLINDQTPDNSVTIAENFIQKYQLDNWKILHLEKNSGLSVVRNKGIDTASGDYLYFMDSDDVITPDCIEKTMRVALETDAEMTISQIECEMLSTGEKSFCIGKQKESTPLIGNEEILRKFEAGFITTSAVNKIFKVGYLRENKLYFIPGLFAQDELWTFHLALKMNKIAFQADVTYTYYLHENSVIHNRGKKNFDNWQTIGEYIDKAYKEEKDRNRKRLILKYLAIFKNDTLIMNWRAQKNETLWKESYSNYKSLSKLSLADYFSNDFSSKIKKQDWMNRLPTSLGFRLFKWRYERG